jgi:hypothetical protein
MMDVYSILSQTRRLRVSDNLILPVFDGCKSASRLLVLIWSQLGDFDNLEYAWWLKRKSEILQAKGISVRAIGIGDRSSGEKFCSYTGFPPECLFIDPTATIHRELNLYSGLSLKFPFLSAEKAAYLNLILMCAGIGSPGTLAEVWRGYKGDRQSPQLIADDEIIRDTPLPSIKGSFFKLVGRSGFQRPFELATLRLKNMTEVLNNWQIYVPNSAYLTQRGGTFLFDNRGTLLYEYRDQSILGFAANMSDPLDFLKC